MQGIGNERLRPEAWVHRHYEHIIHDVEHFGKQLDRSRWIDYYPGMAILTLDQVQRAVEVPCGFLMDRNPVRARIRERWNVLVRIFNHQVAVERELRGLTQ